MIFSNLAWLLWIAFCFTAFFIIVPYVFLRLSRFRKFEKIFIALSVSTFITIFVVYLLAFLRIYHTATLIIGIIVAAVGYKLLFDRKRFLTYWKNMRSTIVLYNRRVYKPQLAVSKRRKRFADAIRHFVEDTIIKHPLNSAVFLIGFVYAAGARCYHALTQMQYGASDLITHINMVKQMEMGNIFVSGVYPFGYHNICLMMKSMFGINQVTVMRFLGCVVSMLIVIGLYALLRTIFQSSLAVNIGFLLYCVSDIVIGEAITRQMFTLPQEMAMVFLYPALIFLFRYLQTKHRPYLALWGVAFALTLLIHFYVTIVAGLLCLLMLAINVIHIFRKKMFLQIVIAGMLTLAVAVLPLMVGLAMGIPWEGSMGWALSLFEVDDASPGEETPDPGGVTDPDDPGSEPGPVHIVTVDMILDRFTLILPKEYNAAVVIIVGAAVVSGAGVMLSRRRRMYAKTYLVFVAYLIAIIAMLLMPLYGLPMIMSSDRCVVFFAYALPVLVAMPIEALHTATRRFTVTRYVYAAAGVCVFVGFSFYHFYMGHIRGYGYSFQNQYGGAYHAYYKILSEYDNNTWTIVSPTDELGMVLGLGYHYEVCDFVVNMENYDETTEIYIPTQYVFIYAEKRPLKFNRALFYPEPYEMNPPLDPSIAAYSFPEVALPTRYYYIIDDARALMEARVIAWAEQYMKYYEREMSVYYEDDEMIVYRIEQNPYALSNLAIDYGYNTAAADNPS